MVRVMHVSRQKWTPHRGVQKDKVGVAPQEPPHIQRQAIKQAISHATAFEVVCAFAGVNQYVMQAAGSQAVVGSFQDADIGSRGNDVPDISSSLFDIFTSTSWRWGNKKYVVDLGICVLTHTYRQEELQIFLVNVIYQ
jgi:hypothetical protein